MTKNQSHAIVKRLVDAFSSGDCSNLPSMKEIEEAAGVLAQVAGENKPDLDRDSKGVTMLTKRLANYLKDLAVLADVNECRDILVEQVPDLDDKLPGSTRKM